MKSINDVLPWNIFQEEIMARIVLNSLNTYELDPGRPLENIVWDELDQLCEDIYQAIERDHIPEIIEECMRYLRKEEEE